MHKSIAGILVCLAQYVTTSLARIFLHTEIHVCTSYWPQ